MPNDSDCADCTSSDRTNAASEDSDADDSDTLDDLFSDDDDIDGFLDGLEEEEQSTSTSVDQEQDEFLSIFKSMAGGIFLVWIIGALVSIITTVVLLYFAFAILQHYGVLVALPLLL